MGGFSVFVSKITQKNQKRLTYNDVPAQIFFGEYQNIPINFNELYVNVRGFGIFTLYNNLLTKNINFLVDFLLWLFTHEQYVVAMVEIIHINHNM